MPIFLSILVLSLLTLIGHCTLSVNASEIYNETEPDQPLIKPQKYIDPSIPKYNDIFFLMDQQLISIASKVEETVAKAPSVITVITADQIENMGAKTLNDVLRIVPGFDMRKEGTFGLETFGVRGVDDGHKQTKVLIDGHSILLPLSGTSIWYFDDLTLRNVKRIEIIRGPGSALYGANAFLAVINIITKDGKDIDGLEVNSGFGSFDSQEYNILYGKEFKGVDVSGFANFYNTNGLSAEIDEDAISNSPALSQFSLAPHDTDDGRKKIDLNMKLSYKNLELRGKYLNKDTEPFISAGSVLTNDNETKLNYVMADLRYKLNIGEKLSVKPRIYYDQYDREIDAESLPDGTIIPRDIDGDGDFESFPDGRFTTAFITNRIVGSELQFDYDIADNNAFTFGFDFEWQEQTNLTFDANFNPPTGASIGEVQDVSDTPFGKELVRQIWAVYFQDKWDITDTLGFTFGVRYDHYSDFEGTTNPRMGLVWNFIDNATLKVLYGQAFRAPDFAQLHTKNNNSFKGDSNLEPEKIRTYEVELAYRFSDSLNLSVNYFYSIIRDKIEFRPKNDPADLFVWANIGNPNIQGIEFEAKKSFGKSNYIFANYTYLDAEEKGELLPRVPKHKGNIGINMGITKYLNANLHTFISDDRARKKGDEREDNSGYALVNLTLTAKEFFNKLKIKASLFNLLDKKYSDPTSSNAVPDDYPRPGRTFFIELGYKF